MLVSTVALLGIWDLRFNARFTASEKYSSLVSVVSLCYVIIAPILIMIVYFQKLKSVNLIYYNRTLVDKYGQIYIKKVE